MNKFVIQAIKKYFNIKEKQTVNLGCRTQLSRPICLEKKKKFGYNIFSFPPTGFIFNYFNDIMSDEIYRFCLSYFSQYLLPHTF